MSVPEKLLFLNEADVLRLLTPADAIAAAEDTFYHIGTGEITVGQMGLMYADREKKTISTPCRQFSTTGMWPASSGSIRMEIRCRGIPSATGTW